MTTERIWEELRIPASRQFILCDIKRNGLDLNGFIEIRDGKVFGLIIPLSASNEHLFMKGPSYDGSTEKILADYRSKCAATNSKILETRYEVDKAYNKLGITEQDRLNGPLLMSTFLENGIGLFIKGSIDTEIREVQKFVEKLEEFNIKISPHNQGN